MDEPANNPDADTVSWPERFIAETDRAIVFVTHDAEPVKQAQNVIAL